ncbi:RNA polymerase sigma factor [Alkalicoccobacillus murimartini]|uniref:RNA polymerase sigma-70 factor (ECF subfamily) n=1 Tax=Alkalicoccobacillus murimartini TaxID=171685 RepID=A0ABT9YLI9_9BACI|nr:RNA polymerase sigma factor [Alkalicoccobacillus murimartini]MDQ0208350.1 RNA polymerase sigma-70 factor (ECF subfamily) [Alkalicoccobacillus murimartini]
MDDNELVTRILEGDQLAVNTLHERYAKKLFNYIYSQTNHYHDSEELIQDIFFKAASNLSHFKKKSSFKTWIFKIARNAIIDYYKSAYIRNHFIEYQSHNDGNHEGADATAIRHEQVEFIHHAINKLPLSYRTVLYLRYIEDFTLKETASVMGKTIYSIKALQKRAQKMLKDDIGVEVQEHVQEII